MPVTAALATVIVGHLDAHHLAPAGRQTFDELRSQAGVERWLDLRRSPRPRGAGAVG